MLAPTALPRSGAGQAGVGVTYQAVSRRRRREQHAQHSRAGLEMSVDLLPSTGILRSAVFKYLPGESRRKILLNGRALCFGLEGDDVLLDHIPLHEILSVTRGDADLPILFDVLDADGDGLVTAWDLLDGLALWGFSPDDVASIFYQDLNNTYFGDRSVLECRYRRRRRRRELRQRQREREDYYGDSLERPKKMVKEREERRRRP